jgi:hypothetical protein
MSPLKCLACVVANNTVTDEFDAVVFVETRAALRLEDCIFRGNVGPYEIRTIDERGEVFSDRVREVRNDDAEAQVQTSALEEAREGQFLTVEDPWLQGIMEVRRFWSRPLVSLGSAGRILIL